MENLNKYREMIGKMLEPDAVRVACNLGSEIPEQATQVSQAISLKRIADNLDVLRAWAENNWEPK